MPAWLVTAINTTALGGFALFCAWAVVRVARFLGPKLTAFFEAHISLIDELRSTGQTTASCLDRLCDMSDHTVRGVDALHEKTDSLARSVNDMKDDLTHVQGKVREHSEILRGRPRE